MDEATLILGCGYTGERLARALRERGRAVFATARAIDRLAPLARRGAIVRRLDLDEPETMAALLGDLPPRLRVVHSIPPWRGSPRTADPTPALLEALRPRVSRWVYLSSTGVYGNEREVDATTPPAPVAPQQVARREAELQVLRQDAGALVLRAPAIYGPGRGVHVLMRAGRYRLVGRGERIGSRIHVDDLAAHVLAGLDASLQGAWPLADEHPAPAAELAAFCARCLGIDLPLSVSPDEVGETQRTSRRVDGAAVRRHLAVRLRYPSYREGIPAALAEEAGT